MDKMILTVFRNRLNPEATQDYNAMQPRITSLAKGMPGYVSHKTFVAEDGERVTLVEFDSAENHRAWAVHPEHIEAQKKGRSSFYLEYDIKVCEVIKTRSFKKQ